MEDLVDMEYVEVVRGCMTGRELRARRLPVVHEPGTDSSGRPFVETMRESWRREEPIVLPGRQERRPWILVDQIDSCARYTDDGVYRWTALHGRVIDPVTGEVARTREETYASAGIADLLRTPPVSGARRGSFSATTPKVRRTPYRKAVITKSRFLP